MGAADGKTRRIKCGLILAALAAACRTAPRTADAEAIKALLSNYTQAVDAADPNLASQIWSRSPETSFIHPLGHAHGWEQIKDFYTNIMGGLSERKLTTRNVVVTAYGDAAWLEFDWHFVAKLKNGTPVETDGRESQIYHNENGRWSLVHVHYSSMPAVPPTPP